MRIKSNNIEQNNTKVKTNTDFETGALIGLLTLNEIMSVVKKYAFSYPL